jgi:hypothetical protein
MATAGKTRYGIGDTPATPPPGFVEIYPKSDKKLYQLDSDGTETDLTAGAAGGTSMQVNTGGALANADFQDSAEIAWTEAAGVVDADLVASSIAYAKIQDVSATSRFLGRITAGAGVIEELTGTQATTLLDDFVGDSGAGGTAGLVPAPGAGDAAAGKYLDSDGTWTVPPAGGTNILLDGSVHSDTVNSAALRGAIIYGTAAPAWDDLPISTADLLLRSDGTDLSWAAYTLDDAYDSGGAGAGKVITADLGPVTINGTNLEGDDLLLVDHTASGVLTQNTIGPAIFRTIRTLTSGADPADDHTNLEITRTSIITSGGTFSTQGALCFIRILDTETSGTIADTSVGMSIRVPSAGSYTGLPLKLSQNTDNEPVFNLTKAGSVQLGVGGVTAPDVTLSHGGVGILDVANVVDANTGFRVAGAAASGNVLRGDGTNFISATLAAADLSDGVPNTRTIEVAGTANEVVSDSGALDLSANRTWTLGIADDPILPGTGAVTVPTGLTGERPTPVNGMIRYNTTTAKFEGREAGAWTNLIGAAAENNDLESVCTGILDDEIAIGDVGGGTATYQALPNGAVSYATGTNTLSQAALANLSDVTGTTGTGSTVVFDTSPTIVTPVIASFATANHDHTDAAGGGTLTTAALTDGIPNTRTIEVAGTANEIVSDNGALDLSANRTWTLGIADNPTIPGDYITVPVKADPDPTGANGRLFYNSTDDELRYASSTTWRDLLYSGGALGTPASGDLSNCTAYPGDSSLVTVGTITSGTWTGTDIANANIVQMAANTIKANATAGLADQADLAVGTNTVVGRVAGNIVAAQLVTAQVADSQITYAKIQDVSATDRFLGRDTVGAGVVEELTGTAATALLDNFVGDSGAGGTKGLVPAPGAGDAAAGKYLDADGTWTVPAGGGDVTGPGSSTDNAIVRWNGTSGTTIQNSGIVITDADLITNASLLGPYMQTAIILEQTSFDYTLTWADPAAARAISIPDPGGTDVFVFRDDTATLTNKTIAAANNTLTLASTDLSDTASIVLETQANTYTAGQKQTFGHDATNAGFNLAPAAGDPSSPANGDIWYNSSTGVFRKRQGGATTDLDTSGAVSLDDAYNNGSTITVDTGTVAWNSTEVGGGVLISEFDHTASGALTAKSTDVVQILSNRTLTSGGPTTDDYNDLLIQRTIKADAGVFTTTGACLQLRSVDDTGAGTDTFGVNFQLLNLEHDPDVGFNVGFLWCAVAGEANPRYTITQKSDKTGISMNFGAGGASAPSVLLQYQGTDILETADGDTFEAGGLLSFRNSTAFGIAFSGTPTADRTITIPDATDTVALLGQTQTLTATTLQDGITTTSFRLPLDGTLDANGEATIDQTNDLLAYFSSSATKVLNPLDSRAHAWASPASGNKGFLFQTETAITGIRVKSVNLGGSTPSVAWEIRFGTDVSAAGSLCIGATTTSNTTIEEDTSFTDASIPAGQIVWVELDTVSGSPTGFGIQFEFEYDRT